MNVGILALQGAFIEHYYKIKELKYNPILVRNKEDFDKINFLIIPGGESTVILKLLKSNDLIERLKLFINVEKKPIMGVCAGLIVLADSSINGFDIKIHRNYYGSHDNSFIDKNKIFNKVINYMFIRAPKIISTSSSIEIISTNSNNEITGIKKENIIGFSFHPELTNDNSIYKYFLKNEK